METGFDFHITLTQYVSKMFKLWKRKNSGSQGWTFIRWREWKCFMIHIIRRVKISKVFNNVAQFPVVELKRQAAKGLLDLCSVIFGLNYIFSINSCSGCQDISVFILLQAVFGFYDVLDLQRFLVAISHEFILKSEVKLVPLRLF